MGVTSNDTVVQVVVDGQDPTGDDLAERRSTSRTRISRAAVDANGHARRVGHAVGQGQAALLDRHGGRRTDASGDVHDTPKRDPRSCRPSSARAWRPRRGPGPASTVRGRSRSRRSRAGSAGSAKASGRRLAVGSGVGVGVGVGRRRFGRLGRRLGRRRRAAASRAAEARSEDSGRAGRGRALWGGQERVDIRQGDDRRDDALGTLSDGGAIRESARSAPCRRRPRPRCTQVAVPTRSPCRPAGSRSCRRC